MAIIASPLSQRQARADSFDDQIAALQQEAQSITGQIGALQQLSSGATAQAAAVAQQLQQTQQQTAAAQAQLDAINAKLAATTAALLAAQAELAADRTQLSQLVVAMYNMRSDGTVTRAIVDSHSFAETMSAITSVIQVSDKVKSLVKDVQTREQQLSALRDEQQQEYNQAAQVVANLQALAAQQAAQQRQLQAYAGNLSGMAGGLGVQLQSIVDKIGQVRAAQAAARAAAIGAVRILGGALPPFSYGPKDDWFPWGQCTWYVASLRDVSWNGDAWQWASTAAAADMSEGMQPRAGAIVVFARGGAYSGFGHVAYVVGVSGPTSFTVDEGNYYSLGVVDQRYIGSLAGVEAFIY
ncbi:MAG: CHAP domain-containing protein [Candidatus Dormibacteraeota bacterium]|nr:CHAP domain-containing protein [Candidatus Dormibacteraeota bacterium]